MAQGVAIGYWCSEIFDDRRSQLLALLLLHNYKPMSNLKPANVVNDCAADYDGYFVNDVGYTDVGGDWNYI